MQTAPVELREPFTERVERLADELTLAIKWNRPSILLAVFQSGYVATNALIALEARLRELGHKIVQFAVDDKDNADIPARLSEYPNREMTVFFVSGLQFGGEAALRALNIRREYFVENRLRVVFWLTEKEAIAVPKYAPDFWAFRHRVVEFVEPPTPEQAVPLARQLAWEGLDDRTAREDTDAKIALRLALLHDLPEGDGTLAARAELQFTLAGLYLAKREFDESIRYWNEAITIAERLDNTQFLAWCYNGLGNVNHGLTRYDDAIAAYQRAIELDPKNAHPHNGVGNVYYALARYDDAIAAYQGAIALDPKFAYPHNGLGAMYRDLARYDDAIAAYQRATELDPNLAYAYGNLADIFAEQGNFSKALELYEKSFNLQPRVKPRNEVGYIFLEQNELDKAAANFEEAIHHDPKDYDPVFNLGLVRAKQGRAEEARVLWQTGLALCQGDGVRDRLNRVLYTVAVGEADRGVAELQRILDEDKPPAGLLRDVLNDAELLASAPNPPAGIERVVEMLSADIKQISG